MSALGAAVSGHVVAILDVSGPYAGSVNGLINTLGTLSGIVGPALVGLLTEVQVGLKTQQKVSSPRQLPVIYLPQSLVQIHLVRFVQHLLRYILR